MRYNFTLRVKNTIVRKIAKKSRVISKVLSIRTKKKLGEPVSLYEKLNDKQKKSYNYYKEQRRLHEEIFIDGGDKYSNKTFFVVRIPKSSSGICTHLYFICIKIAYAIKKQYIPVIDMCHYRNVYHKNGEVGEINTWEYYFCQPMGYKLEDIYHAKNLILSDISVVKYSENLSLYNEPLDPLCFINETDAFMKIREIANKYILFRKELDYEASKLYIQYLEKNSRNTHHTVLGINLRGAEYTKMHPYGHPIQPKISTVIKDARTIIERYGITDIYLSTEDVDIVNQLKDAFKINVFWHDRKLYDYSVDKGNVNDPQNPYKSGWDYLLSIILLTKTDYLLSSLMGSTYAALLFPDNNWKEKKIYWYGRYGIDDK